MPRSLPHRLTGVARALALAAVVAAALTACTSKGGSGDQIGHGTGVLGSAPESPASGATTPPGPTPPAATTPASAPTYPADAEGYATAAVAAWTGRDATRLGQLEVSGGTLHTMLACNGCYDTHFALVRCEGAAGSSYCLFFNAVGDMLRLHLSNPQLGRAHAVVTGSFFDPITFPADDRAYAQEALDAWRAGNDARLRLLTAANTTSAQVTALGPDPAAPWAFDLQDGAAGSLYVSWVDGLGHRLTFRFLNTTGPPPTTGPASQHRIVTVSFGTA